MNKSYEKFYDLMVAESLWKSLPPGHSCFLGLKRVGIQSVAPSIGPMYVCNHKDTYISRLVIEFN